MSNSRLMLLAAGMAAFAVVARLVPHAANVAPIGALALFAGVYFPRRWGIAVPIAAMLASDFFIGFYDVRIMAAVYLSFAFMVGIGWLARRDTTVGKTALAVVSGSVLFFLTTNFAVWAFGTMYPHTLDGLILSYTMALPFARNTFIGDVAFGALFFGGYEAGRYLVTSWRNFGARRHSAASLSRF